MRSEPSETYQGLFYDGESAAAHNVVVRCSTTVVVVSQGSDVLATWNYADLLSHDPLVRGQRARLTHASAPYARLVVDDPGFSDCVLDRSPHLSASAHRRRGFKLVVACMLLAAGVIGAGYVFLTFAPATFAKMMPDTWRNNLGEQVKQILVRNKKLCEREDGKAALAAMAKRLSQREVNPEQFKIAVYDLSIINAFALPGGSIVISRQLIEASSGPDGVAGVLAHEMGHVIERDSEAQLVRSLGITFIQQVLFGGGTVGESVGGLAGMFALLTYTRDAERRADAHALRIMEASGVDPAGLINFFEFIKDKYGSKSDDDDNSDVLSLFSSHPGTSERIESLKEAPAWETRPVLSETEWIALKAICTSAASEDGNQDSDAGSD